MNQNEINTLIQKQKTENGMSQKDISDGYHTFDELYEFRKVYNQIVFNEWAVKNKYCPHKSLSHADGSEMFEDMFIVVQITPFGQISNHYHLKDWEFFNIPVEDIPLVQFDGHSQSDALKRLHATILYDSGVNDLVDKQQKQLNLQ